MHADPTWAPVATAGNPVVNASEGGAGRGDHRIPWSLLKESDNLMDKCPRSSYAGGAGEGWRAYALKEALRASSAAGSGEDITVVVDRFISRAIRAALEPFVRLG